MGTDTQGFYELNKVVTLTADIMFVNGIPFLTTLFRGTSMVTTEFLPSHTIKQLGRYVLK